MRICAVLVFLLPLGALAQEGGFGLDLSGDQKPPEEKPAEEKPAEPEATPPETPASETSAASADAKPEGGEGAEVKKAEAPAPVMHDITEDDRVKSVQRKLYLKARRFEITPMVMASLNDPFYIKFGGNLRVAYHLADTVAVAARGSIVTLFRTPEATLAKSIFTSTISFSVPQWDAMGDVEWSPVYGKVAILNSILHFDAYLLGGLGIVWTATSGMPDAAGQLRGPNVAADVGGGLRFIAKDWLAVNVSVINTAYVDAPAGTKGATQNMLTVNAGVSVFLPFQSTTREAE